MKAFFQIQKPFTLVAIVASLGFFIACSSDDDDNTSTTTGVVVVPKKPLPTGSDEDSSVGKPFYFTFSGGVDSSNEDVAEGVYADTTAGSSGVAGTAGTLEDDKLPKVDDSVISAGKICSYTLEETGLPTLTPLEDESDIGVTDTNGDHSGVAAEHFVEALGDSATYTFQGYEFTVALEGAEDNTGTLRIQVVPQLNVAYSAIFKMHPTDCSSATTSEFKIITLVLAKTTITGVEAGEPAVAYKIFGKNKARTKETQENPDTITIDGFEFELPLIPLNPTKLAMSLKARINGKAFKESDDVVSYKVAPYQATVGRTGRACGLSEGKRLMSGAACLVLTRVLWGAEGNGRILYRESYTKE